MNAFVTGGTGFIGRALVGALARRGDAVTCLVRPGTDARALSGPGMAVVRGDLAAGDLAAAAPALAAADVVYHVAGVTRARDRAGFVRGNVTATACLVDAMRGSGQRRARLVHVSSLAAAGPCREGRPLVEDDPPRPVSVYGATKLEAERHVLAAGSGLDAVALRPPVVYGPGDRAFGELLRWAKRGFLPSPGLGPFLLSLVHVDDLVDALLLAARKGRPGRVYFVSDGREYRWDDVLGAVGAAAGGRPRIVPVPLWLAWLAAAANGLRARLGAEPSYLNPDKWRELHARAWLCSNRRAVEELEFRPTRRLEDLR
jgi:nucleoside-diphosphate-sugar epimerase